MGKSCQGAGIAVRGPALTDGTGSISNEEGWFRIAVPAGTYDVRGHPRGLQDRGAGGRSGCGLARRPGSRVALVGEVLYLGQEVVTASRRQEKILDAPASVSVVEGGDVRNKPALTVADHVKELPAVDFAQTGLANNMVVVRGFNNIFSGSLLTLTDNRIARVPSLRVNAMNFIPLTNEDVERIEVVLGPGSALYGPNSADGVMHVITRSPLASQGTSV